jgi:competence protein ComEC
MQARKLRSPYFWEESPFLRPALALIAGILCYDFLPAADWRIPLLVVAPSLLSALIATGIRRNPGIAETLLQRALVPLFFAALGLLCRAGNDPRLRPGFSAVPPSGPTIAVITSAPKFFESGQSFAVAIQHKAGPAGTTSLQTGGRVVCNDDSTGRQVYLEGDTLLLRGSWEPLKPAGNPFEPDLTTAMQRKGFFFRLQSGAAAISLLARPAPGSQSWLRRAHDACAIRLQDHIKDRHALGLIQAMLLGDEAGFDPLLRGLYADTGVIHIVSISGSHVAMLFALIAALLQWIPGERGAWIRYGTGLLLVWLYVLIAGAPPSALRSAVMFSVVALSTLSKREGRGLNTLCTAAFLLLLAEPAWLFAPGFQLSFAAVLSLMLFYPPLLRLLHIRNKLLRWLWQAVCVSIAAEILTAPIVVAYFHNFPLMFIPANIIAGVVIGAGGLIGGMLVLLCSPLPVMANGIGALLGYMLKFANAGLSALQRMSPEPFRHLYLSPPVFVLTMTLICLLAIAWLQKKRQALLAALYVLGALVTIDLVKAKADLQQQRLIVYNNGRQALIDEIRGRRYSTLIAAKSDFHAAPARMALGARRGSNDSAHSNYLSIGTTRILILSDSTIRAPSGRFPVDILVLTQSTRRLKIAAALNCFSPRTLVLASRFSGRRRAMWADSCRQHNIRLHDVCNSGAWQMAEP